MENEATTYHDVLLASGFIINEVHGKKHYRKTLENGQAISIEPRISDWQVSFSVGQTFSFGGLTDNALLFKPLGTLTTHELDIEALKLDSNQEVNAKSKYHLEKFFDKHDIDIAFNVPK